MSPLDYAAIAFYVVFMAGVGIIYTRRNRSSSDFFRAGGSLTWWLVGSASFVTLFSAWTFVGCAGRIYRTGTSVALIFLFNALALVATYFLAPRFRRLRVVSWVEAVRLRFGTVSEQFFTWSSGAVGLLFGGVSLYTLAVFLAPVFNLPTGPLIVGISLLIILMSATGGAMAVMASDFIQSLFIVAVSVVIAILVLRLPSIGGLQGLVEKSPERMFDWTSMMRPEVLGVWALALIVNQFCSANSLQLGAARYLAVRDERHARLSVFFPMAGMLVLPFITFIPPMAASILLPNIDELFPGLNNPTEASYVAIAMMVLPSGMIGMMVCSIFAATLTSLNSSLSVNAGVATRNVYLVLLHPGANERELLLVGRVLTVLLGLLMMGIGLFLQKFNDLPLFELTLALAGLIGMPMTVPLLLGLFVRRTPDWSGWGTVLFGTVVSMLCWFAVPAETLVRWVGFRSDLSGLEVADMRFALTLFASTIASIAFFFFSKLFNPQDTSERALFFQRMATPIDLETEVHGDSVGAQARMIGWLGIIYGAGVAAFALFTSQWMDRLAFLGSGGIVLLVGFVLLWVANRSNRKSSLFTSS